MIFGRKKEREKKEVGRKKEREEGRLEARKVGRKEGIDTWMYKLRVQGEVQVEMYIWEPSAYEWHVKATSLVKSPRG